MAYISSVKQCVTYFTFLENSLIMWQYWELQLSSPASMSGSSGVSQKSPFIYPKPEQPQDMPGVGSTLGVPHTVRRSLCSQRPENLQWESTYSKLINHKLHQKSVEINSQTLKVQKSHHFWLKSWAWQWLLLYLQCQYLLCLSTQFLLLGFLCLLSPLSSSGAMSICPVWQQGVVGVLLCAAPWSLLL